jgi:hypothetical protein
LGGRQLANLAQQRSMHDACLGHAQRNTRQVSRRERLGIRAREVQERCMSPKRQGSIDRHSARAAKAKANG